MKLVISNTEWATGQKRELLNEIIFGLNPDIVCATEVRDDFYLENGNIIYSDNDYGYKTSKRYKVSLWSRNPWADVNTNLRDAPGGRFLSANTTVDNTIVNMIGVCIPWKSAHVSTGNKNRKLWEDHISYIQALKNYLKEQDIKPQIICGDMNQRIPKTIQPNNVFELLQKCLINHQIITQGTIKGIETNVIDHAAIKGFESKNVYGISRIQNNIEMTDHDIVVCELNIKR